MNLQQAKRESIIPSHGHNFFRHHVVLNILITTTIFITLSSSLDLDTCKAELGMQSGSIPDDDISASSSHDHASVGPHNARLNKELNSGAWCPKRQISKDVYEYLEVSFNSIHVITEVATQGRYGDGRGQEFVEEYMLEYWRPGFLRWLRFRNRFGQQVFSGNTNTYTVMRRKVDPPIIASKVRFVPFSNRMKTVCMRVELYGCSWRDGLLSYSMTGGERRGEFDFTDKVYDGLKDGGYIHSGLGQLTDGWKGPDDFRHDVAGLGRGYGWVGWRNDTTKSKAIVINFEFDTVRNFSMAYFNSNNMFSKGAQVFTSAKIWFSVGGKYFHNPPVEFSYMPDNMLEKARDVTIHLHNRVGRYVRIELSLASRWTLISEVSFVSTVVTTNVTEEDPPPDPPIVSTAISEDDSTHRHVGMVIGLLAGVILSLLLAIVIITFRNKRLKQTSPHSILNSVDNTVTVSMKTLDLTYSPCLPLPCQQKQNGSIYDEFDDSSVHRRLCPEQHELKGLYSGPRNTESDESREYAVPDITKSATSTLSIQQRSNSLTKPTFPQTLPRPLSRHASEKYRTAGAKLPNIQGVSGNNVYAVPSVDLLNAEENAVREIPRKNLRFIEKIGDGQFGEVHLCEAEGIPELVDIPCHGNRTIVAVKSLRKNATEQARSDFYKEVKIISGLRDPNIVHVLGICTKEGPLSMVVEYTNNGDLTQFLRKHVLDNSSGNSPYKSNGGNTLSYGSLIFMANQIASGMKYLESLNFVHRDLATRNCLVGRALSIKIADFGMSRDTYAKDYYRVGGRTKLPIRWMAWESFLMGRFTTKSDIWSFAVTLWEILTFAREQPFSELSDDRVIENVNHFYHSDGHQVYLAQPTSCPREIYDLMKECWQRNENDRPNFREIHLFLQRKNLGYQPQS